MFLLNTKNIRFVIIYIFIIFSNIVSSGSEFKGDLYSDKRMASYAKAFQQGNAKKMVKAALKDLISDSPHPLSSLVMIEGMEYQSDDTFVKIWEKASAKEQKALGAYGDISALISAHKGKDALAKYSPTDEAIKTHANAYNLLSGLAADFGERDLQLDYILEGLKVYPDYFQLVWDITYLSFNPKQLARLRSNLESNNHWQNLPLALIIKTRIDITRSEGITYVSTIPLLENWIDKYPKDVRALTLLGRAYVGYSRYDDAYRVLKTAYLNSPYYSNYPTFGKVALRLGKEAEFRKIMTPLAHITGDNKNQEKGYLEYYVARSWRDAGYQKNAQEGYDKALALMPNRSAVYWELSRLQDTQDRKAERVETIEIALSKNINESFSSTMTFFDALLELGEVSKAKSIFENAISTQTSLDKSTINRGIKLYSRLSKTQLKDWFTKAFIEIPNESSLWFKYADSIEGKSTQLLTEKRDAYKRSFESAPTESRAKSYFDAEEELLAKKKPRGYKAELLSFVDNLAQQYPELNALHVEHLSLLGFKGEREAKFWHELANQFPNQFYLRDKWVRLALTDKDWDTANQRLVDVKDKLSTTNALNYYAPRAYLLGKLVVMSKEIKARGVTKEKLMAIKDELETYKNSISVFGYHEYLQYLYEGLHNKDAAADQLLEQAKLSPFNTGIFHDMVARYAKTNSHTWPYGFNMIQQKPYADTYLSSFLHKHTMWGGSPIVALWAIDRAEKNGVRVGAKYKAKAIGMLGDPIVDFEKHYGSNSSTIAPSLLYINMYNNKVRKVLEDDKSYFVYKFDDETAAVELHKANGEVMLREDSLRLGKPIMVSKGAITYNLNYSDKGNFEGISDKNGDIITLTYDDAGHISNFTSRGKDPMRFEYNELGKPILIIIEGVGQIQVDYDDAGNILKVHSDEGHQMALKVTSQFQQLLSINKKAGSIASDLKFPDFGFGDQEQEYETLKDTFYAAIDNSKSEDPLATSVVQKSLKAFIHYLQSNLDINASYLTEAIELTELVIDRDLNTEQKNKKSQKRAADYLLTWKDLKTIQKPNGLQTAEYIWWVDNYFNLTKIASTSSDAHFGKVLSKLNTNGISLLAHEKWLPYHNLSNPSFWQHYQLSYLFSGDLTDININDSIAIDEQTVLVATSKGLLVGQAGRWRRLGFDIRLGKWTDSLNAEQFTELSNITSLASDSSGNIWLGTVKGVMVLDGSLKNILARYETKNQGLASPAVTDILVRGDNVFVATKKGLSQGNVSSGLSQLDIKAKNLIKIELGPTEDSLIIQSQKGLYVWSSAKGLKLIAKGPLEDFAWSGDEDSLAYISKNRLYFAVLNEDYSFNKPTLANGQEDIQKSKTLYGLSSVNIPGKGFGLAIMTDQGIAFYKDKHIEFMELPLKEKRNQLTLGPRKLTGVGNSLWMVTAEGLYSFGKTKTISYDNIKISDLLTMDKYGVTLAATSSSLGAISHDDNELRRFTNLNARYLAKLSEDIVIVATEYSVVQVEMENQAVTELFELANADVEDDDWSGYRNVTSLLVDSKGDIWVTKGDTLHHYNSKNQTVEQFNYALQPDEFPSRTNSLMTVYERPDNKIYIVGSNNVHVRYKGVNLAGGLIKYEDGKFNREKTYNEKWFATGYTALEDNKYLLGTSAGIVLRNAKDDEKTNRISDDIKQLKEKVPGVFLVRDGVKYDDDAYLIPSAGGLLIYTEGQWFPANNINRQLQDDVKFGQYGSREIYALETNESGTIYVGSRLGLAIFNLGGGVQTLLADNGFGDEAFSRKNVKQLSSLNEQFIGHLDKDSPAARLVSQIKTAEEEIEKLKEKGENNEVEERLSSVNTGDADALDIQKYNEKLKKELTRKQKRTERLIARLEVEHRGLFQMLKLDPRETSSINEKLPDDVIVVQYLPTKENLYIQLTDKENGSHIITLPVEGDKITQSALRVSSTLKERAERLPKLRGIKINKTSDASIEKIAASAPDKNSLFVGDLAWLYDQLIRPIEGKLANYKNIYVVPVGALNYLPFSALVRSVEPKIEYAVEQHQFSTITSLFHLNLVLDAKTDGDDNALLIGNADNTLDFAQQEVEEIAEYFDDSTLLIGDEADYDVVVQEMAEHGVLHFATHAVLDSKTPYNSYLKLASNKHLNVIDISTLDLDATRVAVLSACETGLGITGLEYATMARAFVHAKVPSILASLWSINDETTKDLMISFYSHYREQQNVSDSLAKAQNEMILASGPLSWPEAWAGIVLFGRH